MIALVDRNCAKIGYEFLYLGMADECSKCDIRVSCHHNLEKNRRYRVLSIKGSNHPCKLFTEVSVCEVKEVGIEAALIPGSAFEAAHLTFNPIPCENVFCDWAIYCRPEGLKGGDRCVVEKVKGRVVCPEKGELITVSLRRS
jgi:uncharacterized protein (UPF0179 family)